MFFIRKQIGVTLIELTVVLLVLVALAGIVIPYIDGTSSAALCNATDVTMQNIKKVIMERYYLDTLGKFPQDLDVLASNTTSPPEYNLYYLFANKNFSRTRIHKPFDPETQIGWRGAYLQNGVQLSDNPSSSFQDNTKVHNSIIAGQTQVLDGWGRPIIIQVDTTDANNPIAKLVSAGINTDIDTKLTEIRTNDDRILYLNAPTPSVNPPCNEN